MKYNDHLAVSKTEIDFRNFINLVDASVMVYEAEKEEKIFHLFSTKTRSSRTRRRRNPPNPTSDSETNPPLVSSSLVGQNTQIQRNPPNPNSLFQNPLNPNSLKTEKKNKKKRRATQDISSVRDKKAKVAPLSWKGKATPESLVNLMSNLKGASDPKLVFEKTLSETDCNPDQSRLLMPFSTLIRNDFLNPVELSIVEEEHDVNNDDNLGVGSILIDQKGKKWGVIFKRRDMRKKDSGKVNQNYALICGWSDMVKANKLKDGDSISVWSFRLCGLLCFAIVSPPPATTES